MNFLVAASLLFTIAVDDFGTCLADSPFVSILGDNGMTNPDARFALEAWNACNEVGEETPDMDSPRMDDCADMLCPIKNESSQCYILQTVSEAVNRLKAGDHFPTAGGSRFNSSAGGSKHR